MGLSNKAQVNLALNPSFEDTVGGKCNVAMIIEGPLAGGNIPTRNWFTYKNMSTDFYNYCANYFSGNPYPNWASIPLNCYGYQYPHTGDSYIGMGLYVPIPDSINHDLELAVTKLQQPLKANTCYYGEMYYSLANTDGITINQLGMLLTQNAYTLNPFVFDNTSKYQIQADTTTFLSDTIGWTKISGTFIAQGGEQYLTVGNIRDGGHLKKKYIQSNFVTPCGMSSQHSVTYVFVDDVSLYELPNHTGAKSYTLCAGESLLLGDTVSMPVRYQWSLNGVVIDTTKNITIKPTQSATYVLQTKHCTTQTQTITVVVDDGCNPTEPTIPNVFTPNGDNVNDTFSFKVVGASNLKFMVYNRWGISLTPALSNTSTSLSTGIGGAISNTQTIIWDGRTTSGEACNAGVYFYVLEYTNINGDVKKKNGYISLLR